MDIENLKTTVIKALGAVITWIGALLPDKLRQFLGRAHKISADKVLWIWALVMIAGLVCFKLISGNLPGITTTLVYAQWWEDDLNPQILQELAAEFEAQNPGVLVQLEKLSWPEIQDLLELDEDGKKKQGAPDIFSIDPYAVYDPAGDTVPTSVISFINPLFYNIELIQAAGFDRPPKNQTEFASYAQRIAQGNGVYGAGLALGGSDPHSVSRHLLSWIWSVIGTPDGSEPLKFNSKEIITVLNFLNQLKPSLYPSPFVVSEDDLLNAFIEGKVGMMIGSVADVRILKERMNVPFGITTVPGTDSYQRKPVFSLAVWYAGINQHTDYPEEAQKFIDFLKEKAGIIAAAAYAVPGDGRRNPELSRDDAYYAKAFDMYEAGEMVRELYGSAEAARLNSIIGDEIKRMFDGIHNPEETANAIQERWERLQETLQ
jgi:multiple sugar transport system substrate-binding protein